MKPQPQDAREQAYSKAAEEFYDERGLVVVPGYESEAFRKGFDAGHNRRPPRPMRFGMITSTLTKICGWTP